jgi:uncharacterized protein HemX
MQDTDAPVLLPRQSSFMPWLLFAVAVVAGAGGFVVEKQKADTAEARIATVASAESKARAEASDAVAAKKQLEQRVADLQSENNKLSVKIAAAESVKVKAPVDGKHGRNKHKKHKRASRGSGRA